jgi:hypothetical protein
MDDNRRTDEDRALRVRLEVHLDRQPITGLLRPERGDWEPFVGWIGFAETLQRLHDAATTEREELRR